MALEDYIVLERKDAAGDPFPYSVLKTSKEPNKDALTSVEVARFADKKIAIKFCTTWNGTTNTKQKG